MYADRRDHNDYDPGGCNNNHDGCSHDYNYYYKSGLRYNNNRNADLPVYLRYKPWNRNRRGPGKCRRCCRF